MATFPTIRILEQFFMFSHHITLISILLKRFVHLSKQQIIENINQYIHLWDTLKKSVMKQLMEKDTNLSMRSQRLWMAIGNQDNTFTYSIQMTQTILDIDFSELTNYPIAHISRQGSGEAILYSSGQHVPILYKTRVIKDMQSLKSSSQDL